LTDLHFPDLEDGSSQESLSEGEDNLVNELGNFSENDDDAYADEHAWFRLHRFGVPGFDARLWEDSEAMRPARNFAHVIRELLSVTYRYEDKFELRRAHQFSKVLMQLLQETAENNDELLDSSMYGVPGLTYYTLAGNSYSVRVSMFETRMLNGQRHRFPAFSYPADLEQELS